jgi:predicted nucleic acid-binding Zn ribbon protein
MCASKKEDTVSEKMTPDNHRHCQICGNPVSLGEQFCSPVCEREARRQRRAQRTTTWTLIGLVVFLLVIFFLASGI